MVNAHIGFKINEETPEEITFSRIEDIIVVKINTFATYGNPKKSKTKTSYY